MRIIFEEVDHEYFFEIILNARDLEKFETFDGLIGDFVWEGDGIKDMNVYIRKEKEEELCHSLKEKKPVQRKVSLATSRKKCPRASHKSKPLRSLIAKRVGGKKLLPKRKPQRRKK